MAQRVVTTCDPCDDEGVERSGRPTLLRVDDEQAIVDLCDEHRSVFIAPVSELLKQFGRPEGRAAPVKPKGVKPPAKAAANPKTPTHGRYPSQANTPGGRVYPCPMCPNMLPFGSGAALGSHIRARHDVEPDQYSAWLQARCRGCDGKFESSQALARHIQREHAQPNSASLVAHLAQHDPDRVADIVHALVRGTVRLNTRAPAGAAERPPSLFGDGGEGDH